MASYLARLESWDGVGVAVASPRPPLLPDSIYEDKLRVLLRLRGPQVETKREYLRPSHVSQSLDMGREDRPNLADFRTRVAGRRGSSVAATNYTG